MELAYPFNVRKQEGEYIVSFPDIPEALTGAADRDEAIALARDALVAALGGYIEDKWDIPIPSDKKSRQHMAYLHPLEAAKVALHMAMREQGLSNVGLANRLQIDEKAVRRMLDPDHVTKIDTIYQALRSIFNYRLVVSMEKAA